MEKHIGIPSKENIRKNNIVTKAIIPISLSILLSLSNYSCDNKENNSDIQSKNKVEKVDTKKIDQIREKGMKELSNNEFSASLKSFFILEKIYLESKNNELWNVYRFIGMVFFKQEKRDESLKYFKKSLELAQNCKNQRGILLGHALIGEVYRKLGEDSLTKNILLKGRNIANDISTPNEQEITAKVMLGTDIARWYLKEENNPELAKKYRKECIKLNQQTNSIDNTITIKFDVGDYNVQTGHKQEALKYFFEGIKLAKENNLIRREEIGYDKAYNRYKNNNNPEEALKYKELTDSLKSERLNEESSQQINELNIRYETEKKDQEIKLKDATIDKQSEQKKRMIRTIVAALALALGAGASALIFKKQKDKEKKLKLEISHQKEIVEETNHQLEEKNAEVEAVNSQLAEANKELARKNKNITDSIHYAKRIQESFIQHPNELKKLFPESFMFYQPKDIVSGDFYRFKETPAGKKIIAAVDCTGHGVPGAFLTFIGNNILNDSIEAGKETPGEILDYLSDGIKKQLKEKEHFQGDAIKDAMDIAIFSYDPKTEEFESAGAYNTIYIFKKGKMQKIKGDKLALGQNENTPYTNQKLIIEKGSTVYLGTDGYADQFGGKKNRKFMTRKLAHLLEDLQKPKLLAGEKEQRLLTIQEQEKIIKEEFNDWKGDNEQTDDVLIIGIKV